MLTPCATVRGRCNGDDAQSGGGKREGRDNDVLLIAHLRSSHARTLGGAAKEWESVHGPGLLGAKIPL